MKVKESETLESRPRAPSLKRWPINRLSHPEPESSLTFQPLSTHATCAFICGPPFYKFLVDHVFVFPFRVFEYVHNSIKRQ